MADCREILRITAEDPDYRSGELQTLKEKSTDSLRVLKKQRDAALEERVKTLQEINILSQLNTELCKIHKGVGEEISIKKGPQKGREGER